MKRPQFVTDYFYHIYNRGVEKRDIFLDDADHFRFIRGLYEFNDSNPTALSKMINFRGRSSELPEVSEDGPRHLSRKKIVEIVCFCLMPNHFHLLLKQIRDNGIPLFMKKLATGYAMYFNTKYKRSGVFFQGRYKAIIVEKEEYLLHLSRYIHLNPVELIEPQWKERGIKDKNKVFSFLENYRWSSYPDYIGKKNFPSITKDGKDIILEIEGGSLAYKRFVESWLEKDFQIVQDTILE